MSLQQHQVSIEKVLKLRIFTAVSIVKANVKFYELHMENIHSLMTDQPLSHQNRHAI